MDVGKELARLIVPIIRSDGRDKWKMQGTGFFILKTGVIASAKHVLIRSDSSPSWLVSSDSALPYDKNLAIVQHFSKDPVTLRNINSIFYHAEADIAVAVLEPLNDECGNFIENGVSPLAVGNRPSVGDSILAFGHPTTELDEPVLASEREDSGIIININDYPGDRDWYQQLQFRLTDHRGEITSFHKYGHRIIKGPCFSSSINMLGGTSGGPVISTSNFGGVFGLSSAGMAGEKSTISSIDSLLEIEIPSFPHNETDGNRRSISKLIQH